MHHKKWKLLTLFVLIMLLVPTLAACAPADEPTPVEPTMAEPTEPPEEEPTEVPPTEPPPTEEPTEEPPAEPKLLVITQPIQYTETYDISLMATVGEPVFMVYDTLVSMDPTYQYQPGALTDSYEVSDDGTVTTFHLKEGITFHDGSPFNAEAVKWNVELVQTGGGCCAYLFTPVTEVEVVDEYTVAMHTDGPFPGLLFNLSSAWGYMMSPTTYAACGEGYGLTPECIAGTGPFMLEEWVQNDHFLLNRNPDYNWAAEWTGHEGPANVDQVLFRIIPEDATRLVELEAGDLHLVMSAPWRELPTYQDDPNYQVVQIPDATIWFVGFNLNAPIVGDLRTRQAIGHTIDRDLIQETLYLGLGAAKTTYLASEIGGDQGITGPDFDLAQAQALLAEAGWVLGDDGVLVAESVDGVDAGTVFDVGYLTYNDDEARRLAEVTQNMFAEVGIKVNIQQVDKPTYDSELEASNFVLILRRYTWDNNDILPWFHHSQYLPYPNYVGTNDPDLDKMMDDADYATDSWEQRDVEYRIAHQYLIDTYYPWAPIFQRPGVNIARASVLNLVPIPLRGLTTESFLMVDLGE
jgi:peptide/nickel transport system substrate-binding protein